MSPEHFRLAMKLTTGKTPLFFIASSHIAERWHGESLPVTYRVLDQGLRRVFDVKGVSKFPCVRVERSSDLA